MSVSFAGFVPSAAQTHSSEFPELSDSKTILFPSGEMRGLLSFDDKENKGFDVGFIASLPVISILQISELPALST